MEQSYITDKSQLVAQMSRFVSFVQHENRVDFGNEDRAISFCDTNGFLGDKESYKSEVVFADARQALGTGQWKESWIGTGRIAERASAALDKAGNLVNYYQRVRCQDILNPAHASFNPSAERALYDIYHGHDEAAAFAQAVEVFGGSYELIAFLFFIKNDRRFLPVSSGHFDRSFEKLGIPYSMSGKCTWENYQGFLSIIADIRDELEDFLPMRDREQVRLIDAHSFAWIVQEDGFLNWEPDSKMAVEMEQQAERHLGRTVEGAGGTREHLQRDYNRSPQVAEETKRRANGVCQLCGQPAPFSDKSGRPYLEAHHVVWLSRGGKDSTDNTVALCPNCHTKMHVVDDPADVQFLKSLWNNG